MLNITSIVGIIAVVVGFGLGVKVTNGYWHHKRAEEVLAQEKETNRLIEQNAKLSTTIVKEIEKERVVTRNIYVTVEKRIPVDAPDVSFIRLLHDQAATGTDPSGGSINDDSPVPLKDLAQTIVENYGACRQDQEKLKYFQERELQLHGKNSK